VCLRNAFSDIIGLEYIKVKKNTLDSGGKTKDAPRSPHCYSFCTVFLSALSQVTQSLCRQKIFETAVIDKTFKTNNK